MPLLDRRVQPVDEEEEAYECQCLDGPARDCGAEQRKPPPDDLRVPTVAVGTGLDQLARFKGATSCLKERNSRMPAAHRAKPETAADAPKAPAVFRSTGSGLEGRSDAETVSPTCIR